RIIFLDTETSNWAYDKTTSQYYWHRFFSSQPDLNFDNPLVQEEMIQILEFWLDKGLDGFRIDAVPYLFEREGTSCENLPETHRYLKQLRTHVDSKYGKNEKILLAEANMIPEELLPYFGDGKDEFHMAFNFPLMTNIFLALAKETPEILVPLLEDLTKTPDLCQWAIFLRNHDELTLEKVSEDTRQFMWDYYAPKIRMRSNLGIRRRLAPLLDNDINKLKMINSLLFSLPGSPVLYYGDEIGMGDNIQLEDRNGVRTPMQWTDGTNAGFSQASSEKLIFPILEDPIFGYQHVNVTKQTRDEDSIYHFIRKLIGLRKEFPFLGYGGLITIRTSNPKILCYLRANHEISLLILHNFSPKDQICSVDLSEYHFLPGTEFFDQLEFSNNSTKVTIELKPYQFLWIKSL
ncbi:MAG: alpha-amylase family glycosyl hydrolase, partial [Candidatus Kariarchaeaceae archaeon]